MLKITSKQATLIKLQRTGFGIADDISTVYHKSLQNDYNDIHTHLNNYKSVLDVGCGMAGINLMLDKPDATFYLFDKTQIEKRIYYGFNRTGCFYNSLEEAANFLKENGMVGKICSIDIASGGKIDALTNIDLVISLISWGFHYPIPTYINDVNKILAQNGIIIVDLRKERVAESIKEFEKLNYKHTIIRKYSKYFRTIFQRNT